MKWNAGHYADNFDFVFKYGEDLVGLLDPKPGEKILDLGCGTGHLTQVIAESGASVVGIDSSEDMISKARTAYPGLDFRLASASDFHLGIAFDAIFSNAVLHWVLDYEKAVDCLYDNLAAGGRLVVEFGGKGNVAHIVEAITGVLARNGFTENAQRRSWYFPSLSEYTTLLEQKGFRVLYARHFDRETELKDQENGIKDWVGMFGDHYMTGIAGEKKDGLLTQMQEALRPTNFRNNKWYGDYKRLRIVAIKQ